MPASSEKSPESSGPLDSPSLKVQPPNGTSQAPTAGRQAKARRSAATIADLAAPPLRLCSPPQKAASGTSACQHIGAHRSMAAHRRAAHRRRDMSAHRRASQAARRAAISVRGACGCTLPSSPRLHNVVPSKACDARAVFSSLPSLRVDQDAFFHIPILSAYIVFGYF